MSSINIERDDYLGTPASRTWYRPASLPMRGQRIFIKWPPISNIHSDNHFLKIGILSANLGKITKIRLNSSDN
jgi:hypothetical protein